MRRSTLFRASAAGLACGLLALVPAGQAQTLTVGNSPYEWGQGGEFNAVPHGFFQTPVSLTTDGTFQTFCVQSQVSITPGQTYAAAFSMTAPGGPALNEQTAYLYDQFIRGVLPNYDYTNASNSRQSDAGALQYAIWQLEGQTTSGIGLQYNPLPSLTAEYVTLADTNAVAGDFYGVQIVVLQTTGPNPSNVQNLLAKVVPAPSTAAMLGLGGLVAGRRRRSLPA